MKTCILCWMACVALTGLALIAGGLTLPPSDLGHTTPAALIGIGTVALWGAVCGAAAYLTWPRKSR